MGSKKDRTYEQAEAMQTKAVRFLRDVVGDDEKANEIEGLSVSEYAERKGLRLTNPSQKLNSKNERGGDMQDTRTKTELIEELDAYEELVSEIWDSIVDVDSDSSKEDLISATDEVADLVHDFDPEAYQFNEDADTEEEEAA